MAPAKHASTAKLQKSPTLKAIVPANLHGLPLSIQASDGGQMKKAMSHEYDMEALTDLTLDAYADRDDHAASQQQWRNMACCVIAIVTTLCILVIVTLTVIFFLFRSQKSPVITIDGIRFQEMNITGWGAEGLQNFSKGDGLEMSTFVNVTADLHNPNSREVVFETATFAVGMFGLTAARVEVDKFNIPKKSNITTAVPFQIRNFKLLSNASRDPIEHDLARGQVQVEVIGDSKGHVKLLSFKSPTFKVWIRCNLTVSIVGMKILSNKCVGNK
eukprot:TRINITY_DN9063_c0_g1_i2.p1 TRINITY_DN9063_c0_g1~~TRINITY_DN9063_c0_g1_i2.p1  ORF type:complete len:273 (+),score=6.94 TRINITY_DN9063_c0_g1_i2:226-1044(+)